MTIVYFGIGIVVGVIITLITSRILAPKQKNNTEELQQEIAQRADEITQLHIAKATVEGELTAIKVQHTALQEAHKVLNSKSQELIRENGVISENNQSLLQKQEEITAIEDKFKKEFELIAGRLMHQNAQSFNDASNRSLKSILDPLKERIGNFEKEISDKYLTEAKDKASLKTEIQKLVELNSKLSDDASNLTNALKGSNKQQGNWGEVVLEKVLERSGLEKGTEFSMQQTIHTEDGSLRRPDAVVFLPDQKHIIIDSKVSLTAYERMVNAETDQDTQTELKLHLTSLKNHIKELSDKSYYDTKAYNSPEFTLLFIPIEASFSLALREDPEIFSFAWDKNIILVSPTTMLATLRTVASIWKHEKQTKHVLEIAKEGGALYDKFVGFIEDLQKIEKGIHQSQTAYNSAFNKLKSGNGNIITRTNKLKVLGAKAKKALSANLVDESNQVSIEAEKNETN